MAPTLILWKQLFTHYYTLRGPHEACGLICQDPSKTKACSFLLEFLDASFFDAPELDIQATSEKALELQKASKEYREKLYQLPGAKMKKQMYEMLFPQLDEIPKHGCWQMLNHACPVACIRKDSGNLPNQKGYVPEYTTDRPFLEQFQERYKERYDREWEKEDFDTEFGFISYLSSLVVGGVGALAALR